MHTCPPRNRCSILRTGRCARKRIEPAPRDYRIGSARSPASEPGQPRKRIARRHLDSLISHHRCGCSSMVELQLPKLLTWVRFPSPAPSPWQRQASCVNRRSGKVLIAWEIPWPEPVPAGTCRCRGLPGIAPAFAPIVALDSDRILQVRIGGCERPRNSSQSNALQSATGLNFRCRPGAGIRVDLPGFPKVDTVEAMALPA